MGGIRSWCTSNPHLGIVGCGQSYAGELQHCVASVSWSEHPDGLAHVTAKLGNLDAMWRHGHGEYAHPASLGLVRNQRGVWTRANRRGARPSLHNRLLRA
jgi:hypothetical protein